MWPVCWCHHCCATAQTTLGSVTVLLCTVTPLHMYSFLLLCCNWPKFLHLQLTAFKSDDDDPTSPTIPMEWASLATVQRTVRFQLFSVLYASNCSAYCTLPTVQRTVHFQLFSVLYASNCSAYCTLPTSVCILLQINIHAFFRLTVYFYYCFWNQTGVTQWKWIRRSWFRCVWQFCESEWITNIKTLTVCVVNCCWNRFVHVNIGMKGITVMIMCSTFLLFMVWILMLTSKTVTI
jgi:hypothetical protein